MQHHQQQNPNHQTQRTHTIMSAEKVASGKKPDPWHGLEVVGSVRNLSPALWNMTHLTTLYLNDNCLTRIPPDIGRLTQLRHLDLSSNKLRGLPREIGELILLEELLLNDNQLRSLPLEMGKLFHLKRLNLKGNPSLNQELLQIYQEPKGAQKLITYLLEHLAAQCPAPRPSQRPWVLMDQPVDRTKPSCMFTTMCYNVLCDKYATRQLYGYCPTWALSWDYRKHSILEELKAYSADLIALQEVETEQYHDYFLRELQQEGYDGIFSPKSRAKTMSESERKHVDGCAIFYKTSKFSLVTEHLIEFNQLAMANAEGSDDMLNRVMTKDNIAIVALLQIKDGAFDSFQPGGSGSGSGGGPGTIGASSSSTAASGSAATGGNSTATGVSSGAGAGPGTGGGAGGGGMGGLNLGGNGTNNGGISVANAAGSLGGAGNNNATNATINVTSQPLHQQRLLVCAAHIHWDPEFCDVKIIQTIMLTHELQAIANQAARDLVASSGQDINTVAQYYLRNSGTLGIGSQNHIGSGRLSSTSQQQQQQVKSTQQQPPTPSTTTTSTTTATNSFGDHNNDEQVGAAAAGGSSSNISSTSTSGDDSRLDNLGAELIPLILCGDFNSLPDSSVVEFLSNGGISADHQDFKELAYKDCLRKICNSRSSALANSKHSQTNQCNQYSGQSLKSSSISATISSSLSTSSSSPNTNDQQQQQQSTKASPNDSLTNTSSSSNGNENRRPMNKNGTTNHTSMSGLGTTNNSESSYTHPFSITTAYTGDGAMPFTNYTFDFRGVIDYIFYSKNLMSVLGVSGLDKTWLVENKILGLPHPYFPSDHFPLYVELEILPTPRSASVNRYKQQLQPNHPLQQSQLHPHNPQHNKKNDFFQNPMRKSFFGT